MALVIEDGSIVADANSYGVTDEAATRTAAISYAADRGVTISSDDIDKFLINGADYIETFNTRFIGEPVDPDQPLSFPRKCIVKSDGSPFPIDELPETLLKALYQTCIEQQNGIVLLPSYEGSKGFITEERVDVIETKYLPKIRLSGMPSMPAVDALLQTLLKPTPALRNYRV